MLPVWNTVCIVEFETFWYYQCIHGSRFPKPVLLLPVEHFRRVSVLVFDLLHI
jgi:hypothetical protein